MKYIAPALVAIIAAATFSLPANAQFSTFAFGVNGTESQLQARITEGMRTGSLTRTEARELQNKLSRIQSLETRFRAYNGLSPRERERLNAQLVKLSNEIDVQMHDFQRRHDRGRGNAYGRDRNWRGQHNGWGRY